MKHWQLALALSKLTFAGGWLLLAPGSVVAQNDVTTAPEPIAAAGDATAKFDLADRYFRGDGVPKDAVRAAALFQEAAQWGLARAQTSLAWMYLKGEGDLPRDAAKALQWFEAAAAQDDSNALFALSFTYGSGKYVPKDELRAWQYAARAAELKHPVAMQRMAQRLFAGPVEQRDPARAMQYLIGAAETGREPAIYLLGSQCYRGITGRDASRALQTLQRATDQKLLPAQIWMAQMYARGRGVAADITRAEELFTSIRAQAPAALINEFAWELAISADASIRDGGRATALMKEILADPKQVTPARLDTLAAAYAAAGQFAEAVTTQLLAIKSATADSQYADSLAGMTERLGLYRSGRAYTESL